MVSPSFTLGMFFLLSCERRNSSNLNRSSVSSSEPTLHASAYRKSFSRSPARSPDASHRSLSPSSRLTTCCITPMRETVMTGEVLRVMNENIGPGLIGLQSPSHFCWRPFSTSCCAGVWR